MAPPLSDQLTISCSRTMAADLLPKDFDSRLANAVATFWATRAGGSNTQGGTRGNVIAGKNLDGFLDVVASVVSHCGLPAECLHTTGRANLTLPGFFRPTKNWDAVIVYRRRLLAALEFKSQVGSFGNNFNNRTEEVLGNATDLLTAHREGAFSPRNAALPSRKGLTESLGAIGLATARDAGDPRPPFLGYLMLLEDAPKSTSPVKNTSPHFGVSPVFDGASYADRYQVLCERLISEKLYQAAALVLSPQDERGAEGFYTSKSQATSATALFSSLAASLLGAHY